MADTDVITLGNLKTFKTKADALYLSQSSAATTYLSQTDASSTYLSQANASSTYLSQASASSTYLTQTDAENTYAGINETKFTGTTTVALGGISKNTVYSNADIKDLLEDLLIPYVASTCSSFSLSPSAGVKEKGTTVTLSSATVGVSKGSKDIGGHTISVYSGSTVYGSVAAGSVVSGNNAVSLSGSITANTTLTASVYDGQSTATRTATYTFVDPYFYGVVSDLSSVVGASSFPSGLTKVIQSKGTKTYSVSPSSQYIVYAFPVSYGTLSSIKDGNGFENIGGFSYVDQTMTVTSGSVSYRIYYTADVKTASNFSLTFTH